MNERRPRRKEEVPALARSDMDICAAKANTAVSKTPGSRGAIQSAQAAIFHLMRHLAPVIDAPSFTNERARWIGTLQFLHGTASFPALSSLLTALHELNRGVVDQWLEPAAGGQRGGLSGTDEVRLMSFAVEAADELRSRCLKVAEWESELKSSECSRATIEKYRKVVMNAPPDMRPRSSYVLSWGREPPEIVLQRVVWALQDLRRKRREQRPVTT